MFLLSFAKIKITPAECRLLSCRFWERKLHLDAMIRAKNQAELNSDDRTDGRMQSEHQRAVRPIGYLIGAQFFRASG